MIELTPEMIAHAEPVQFYTHLSDELAAASFYVNGAYLDIIFLDGYPIYYRDLMTVIGRWFDHKSFNCEGILPNLEYLMTAFKVVRRSRRTDDQFNKVEDLPTPTMAISNSPMAYGPDVSGLPMFVVWETLIKIRYVQDGGDFRLFLRDLVDEVRKAREGALIVP